MDCSSSGSSVHGIFQVRILEWVAISFSRDLPNPGIFPTQGSCLLHLLHLQSYSLPLRHLGRNKTKIFTFLWKLNIIKLRLLLFKLSEFKNICIKWWVKTYQRRNLGDWLPYITRDWESLQEMRHSLLTSELSQANLEKLVTPAGRNLWDPAGPISLFYSWEKWGLW